jgi:hypothetical protein
MHVPWFLRPRRLIQAVVLATVAFALWTMSMPNRTDGRLSCKNDGCHCGRERPVHVDAALPSSDAGRDEEGPGGHIGRDGQRWTVVE